MRFGGKERPRDLTALPSDRGGPRSPPSLNCRPGPGLGFSTASAVWSLWVTIQCDGPSHRKLLRVRVLVSLPGCPAGQRGCQAPGCVDTGFTNGHMETCLVAPSTPAQHPGEATSLLPYTVEGARLSIKLCMHVCVHTHLVTRATEINTEYPNTSNLNRVTFSSNMHAIPRKSPGIRNSASSLQT